MNKIKIKVYESIMYRGVFEKGSDDIGSAVCYTIYTIHISLCTQTDETTSSDPFSRIPLYFFIYCVLKIKYYNLI